MYFDSEIKHNRAPNKVGFKNNSEIIFLISL